MAATRANTKIQIEPGSGNVFSDLKMSAATERQTKVRLAATLNLVLEERGLTQCEAAERLGVSQPKISALLNYRLTGFSVERLMHFLVLLGSDVEIVVRRRPRARRPGQIVVTAA